MKQKVLMLGAGHTKPVRKLRAPDSAPEHETVWWTLDMNKNTNPDIYFNLNRIESWVPWWNRIPVKDETFDEIHAYQTMEHFGRQGDYKGFFRGMRELWRILKPGGWLIGNSPAHSVMWTWGDPGHTRVICEGTFLYVDKWIYGKMGKSPATDYAKYVGECWWKIIESNVKADGYHFGLQKVVE